MLRPSSKIQMMQMFMMEKVYSTEVFCFEGKEEGCYKVQETDPTFFKRNI